LTVCRSTAFPGDPLSGQRLALVVSAGFSGWQQLDIGVDTSICPRLPYGTVAMSQLVTPQLRATSWERTRAFYVDGLGFQVDWQHQFEPGFPVFAQVSLDGRALFLTEHKGDCQVGGAAYIIVDDVDALYRTIRARGVYIDNPPQDAPWGGREMSLTDPDGNRLRFATPQRS
jgi:catechol 2,3-dioxygenase-like lactoylglutathione lyase family enzyme